MKPRRRIWAPGPISPTQRRDRSRRLVVVLALAGLALTFLVLAVANAFRP